MNGIHWDSLGSFVTKQNQWIKHKSNHVGLTLSHCVCCFWITESLSTWKLWSMISISPTHIHEASILCRGGHRASHWNLWSHESAGIIAPTASRAGTWWLLWLGKLRWCTRKGKIKFWCSNDLCFVHSCSMCDLNVSAWMWDLRKLKLLCRVEALQDLLSWVTSSHIFWGLYIWESIESIEHCQTMSNPNSAVKCGTFISQLKNCSQGRAEGPTSCYQWGFIGWCDMMMFWFPLQEFFGICMIETVPSSALLGTAIPPESLGWFTKGLATWHYSTRA